MRKVSLILCTYNCEKQAEKTLQSILRQDYQNLEVVAADGGSKDNTLQILEKYRILFESAGKTLLYHSEPDHGIYDAMNKGYRMSTGEVVAFFNDLFVDDRAVSMMMEALEERWEECIGVHADLVYATDKKVVRYWKMGQGDIRKGWMPGHPTLYLKREIYEKYGLYQTDYKVSADYELMVRVLKHKENRLAYVPKVLVRMYYGGTSTGSASSYLISLKEGHRALTQNGIRAAWLADVRRTFRLCLQFLRASKIEVPGL